MRKFHKIIYLLILIVLLFSCSRWNNASPDLWGRMDKAAQDKLAREINKSFIALHPGCRRSALNIDSYPEAIVIRVKCADEMDDEKISNAQLIEYTEPRPLLTLSTSRRPAHCHHSTFISLFSIVSPSGEIYEKVLEFLDMLNIHEWES